METKEKWEAEDKKEIEKRLRLSDEKKWNTLTSEERQSVVKKYYNLRSIEHRGIDKILDDNRDMRRNFLFLILGLLLGILGSLFADVMLRYVPQNPLLNVLLLLFLAYSFWYIFQQMDKMSVEHLNQENILDALLKLVKQDRKKR
jgi:ABC-type bacteriocin/lantibiotic exporter with double-glycine peptidase domain